MTKESKEHKEKRRPHDGSKRKGQDETDRIADLTETSQRLQAQYENFQKRVDKEKALMSAHVRADVLRRMLVLLDAFDGALRHVHDPKAVAAIKPLAETAEKTMQEMGVRPMETVGRAFDSHYHEALLVEERSGKDNIILEEFQKGYMLGDQVLRHAKVKVGKEPDEQKAQTEDETGQKGKGTQDTQDKQDTGKNTGGGN
ncbi:MAG: nucleotide exchange factor GrpE [DPANN group archaeon]|nr:nucleotide exchange factor GrpE [DPANN group archaeon]